MSLLARKIKSTSEDNCPVGTPTSTGIPGYIGGSLKKSHRLLRKVVQGVTRIISVAVGGRVKNPNTGEIVDYAKKVHDGTSKMPSRPFLKNSIDQHKQTIVQMAINAVKRTR